jgi:hypothetical protein
VSETQFSPTVRSRLRDGERSEPWLEAVRDALRGLQYGSVVITVQDGVAIQVDRTEKHRLRRARSPELNHSHGDSRE